MPPYVLHRATHREREPNHCAPIARNRIHGLALLELGNEGGHFGLFGQVGHFMLQLVAKRVTDGITAVALPCAVAVPDVRPADDVPVRTNEGRRVSCRP